VLESPALNTVPRGCRYEFYDSYEDAVNNARCREFIPQRAHNTLGRTAEIGA
jgi:hypothetical protein